MGCTGSKTASAPKTAAKKDVSATLLQDPSNQHKATAEEICMPCVPELQVFHFKPCDSDAPTKDLGTGKMWINKAGDGKQFTRIKLEAGFDWKEKVRPLLPGCPEWCPATHFGYLESGSMLVKMQDGTEHKINAGETYCIPPGHLPVIEEPTVMIEFSQDATYKVLSGEKADAAEAPEDKVPVPPSFFQCAPSDSAEPTKLLDGAKMFISKQPDGRQVMRAVVTKDFDWTKSIKPLLPGCPEWCPASHFGYLESGRMHITMQDGSTATINAGESYFVPPGHLPRFEDDTVFVEFSQDQTYTNKSFLEKEAQPTAADSDKDQGLEEAPKSKFFAVYHTFKSTEAATAFWKMMGDTTPEELAKMNADWDAMGFHNHFFLPDGGDSAACCIWETKSETTVADFQAFIDSEKGPGGGQTFINRVTHAAHGSKMPPSFFDGLGDSSAVVKPTTGAFFWIDHTFMSAEKAAAFWKVMIESKPEDLAKMNEEWDAMGFHNHLFCPEGGAGQTICLWESRSDLTKAEFQAFIDSEKGPGGGDTFNNEVHKVAPGGVLPSAFFTAVEEQAPLEQQSVPEPKVSVQPEPTVSGQDVNASRNPCLRYCIAAEAETEFVVHQ